MVAEPGRALRAGGGMRHECRPLAVIEEPEREIRTTRIIEV
jgi:hypothetical protein